MVKECKVLINNDSVTVFQFDDVKVQVPAVGKKRIETVKVLFENGSYKVVDDDYKEKEEKAEKPVKKTIAKETEKVQKKVEETDVDEEK